MDDNTPKKRKQKGWITPTVKANIVLDRQLRRETGMSNAEIAEKHGTTENMVVHMTEGNIGAEARKILRRKREKLAELALDTTIAALEKGKELVDKADKPGHLSGIAALGKFSDNVYRLESGQPTEITQSLPAESHALDFIAMLMERMSRDQALEAFRQARLDPLVPEARKSEILRRIETGELKLLTP
jgi:hypothetical protein